MTQTIKKVEKPAKQAVETALVGFCFPCQIAHIKEHVHWNREEKVHCCNRTGRKIDKDGFRPPIQVVTDQSEVNDPAYQLFVAEEADPYYLPEDVPSLTAMVPGLLEDVVKLLDINPAKHTKELEKMTKLIQSWIKEKAQPEQLSFIETELEL